MNTSTAPRTTSTRAADLVAGDVVLSPSGGRLTVAESHDLPGSAGRWLIVWQDGNGAPWPQNVSAHGSSFAVLEPATPTAGPANLWTRRDIVARVVGTSDDVRRVLHSTPLRTVAVTRYGSRAVQLPNGDRVFIRDEDVTTDAPV